MKNNHSLEKKNKNKKPKKKKKIAGFKLIIYQVMI